MEPYLADVEYLVAARMKLFQELLTNRYLSLDKTSRGLEDSAT